MQNHKHVFSLILHFYFSITCNVQSIRLSPYEITFNRRKISWSQFDRDDLYEVLAATLSKSSEDSCIVCILSSSLAVQSAINTLAGSQVLDDMYLIMHDDKLPQILTRSHSSITGLQCMPYVAYALVSNPVQANKEDASGWTQLWKPR